VLNNPNYNLDLAHLERPDLALGETRDAPWSDPSPAAEHPYLDRFFVGNLKRTSGDLDPLCGFGVKKWFPTLAAEGYVKFDDAAAQLRGAMLNGTVSVAYASPGK